MWSRPSFSAVALLALLAATTWPMPAAAQVRRCVGTGGQVIYTDKRCEEIGAVERLVRTPGAVNALPPYRGGCSRRLGDLVNDMTVAIDARDVNRLAMLYDFAGMSTRQGYAVMTRLDGIAKRPLFDILPIYSRPQPVLDADGNVIDANADGYYPQANARRAPVGLRVEQTFTNGITPITTRFGLRKRLGCWWVTL